MLVVIALIAIWFSTSIHFLGNDDVRRVIALLLLVACATKTYCSFGRQRCFWLAFSFVLVIAFLGQGMIWLTMTWVRDAVRPFITPIDIYGDRSPIEMPSMHRVEFLSETVRISADLILAAVAGLKGRWVYDQSQPIRDE
jgi:hypothetical protein